MLSLSTGLFLGSICDKKVSEEVATRLAGGDTGIIFVLSASICVVWRYLRGGMSSPGIEFVHAGALNFPLRQQKHDSQTVIVLHLHGVLRHDVPFQLVIFRRVCLLLTMAVICAGDVVLCSFFVMSAACSNVDAYSVDVVAITANSLHVRSAAPRCVHHYPCSPDLFGITGNW